MNSVGRDPPLVTDSDIEAFALQFLDSGYVYDMYANWPLDRRLDRFLRQHGLSHLADDGDICKTILDRVMTFVSIKHRPHTAVECALAIRQEQIGDVIVVSPVGVLDFASYATLRTALVKAATEQPAAVLVDVDGLDVPAPSAWTVLTRAHWLVSAWPGVPICVVATDPDVNATLKAIGISRYVPTFGTRMAAAAAIADSTVLHHYWPRVVKDLPRHPASIGIAREFIRQSLVEWSHPEYIERVEAIATELIRNVSAHTTSAPQLWLELKKTGLTVAVADHSPQPAVLRKPTGGAYARSGLGVVSRLSRVWGSHPSREGKVVWAVIGPTEPDG